MTPHRKSHRMKGLVPRSGHPPARGPGSPGPAGSQRCQPASGWGCTKSEFQAFRGIPLALLIRAFVEVTVISLSISGRSLPSSLSIICKESHGRVVTSQIREDQGAGIFGVLFIDNSLQTWSAVT